MPKLKTLGARDIFDFLKNEGFVLARQKGSHVVFMRELVNTRQIPDDSRS